MFHYKTEILILFFGFQFLVQTQPVIVANTLQHIFVICGVMSCKVNTSADLRTRDHGSQGSTGLDSARLRSQFHQPVRVHLVLRVLPFKDTLLTDVTASWTRTHRL